MHPQPDNAMLGRTTGTEAYSLQPKVSVHPLPQINLYQHAAACKILFCDCVYTDSEIV